MVVWGQRSRIARMVSAKWRAPSTRSSRSADVTTMCARSSLAVTSATGRLTQIERSWQSGLYIAERARARARIAHDHERRVFLFPALANIRTAGFLANRVQAVVAHDLLSGEIAG